MREKRAHDLGEEKVVEMAKAAKTRPGNQPQGPPKNPSHFIALHRYFIWCNNFENAYKQVVLNELAKGRGIQRDQIDQFVISAVFNMSYWYGALYVVIEGYRKLQLRDPEVNSLLKKKRKVQLLKEYRHGVFHFQAEYWDQRFMNFVSEQGTAEWAIRLHGAFSAFFLRETQRVKEEIGA